MRNAKLEKVKRSFFIITALLVCLITPGIILANAVGDINGDGRVDVADVRSILAGFRNIFDLGSAIGSFGQTSGLGPTPPPASGRRGIWISRGELANLPMAGSAWTSMKSAADGSWGSPDLANQNSQHPQSVLAGALVYARTGQESYRAKTAAAIMSIIGTENNPDSDCGNSPKGARSLALGRNLAAYAISADLIDLPVYDAASNERFRSWLSGVVRRVNCEGMTIISCHNNRPNNWGTMCGASRIAVDLYLGDSGDLAEAVKVFHGWVGDRSSYASFAFGGSESWMCDPTNPRPLNPVGCVKDGHDLSGAPVDDVRRGGGYTWPPSPTDYAWGGFSGGVAQAEMLYRAGYDSFNWENQVIRRGMNFLQTAMASSQSAPTEWVPWVVNMRYGANFTAKSPTGWGRLVGWTDWTHGR